LLITGFFPKHKWQLAVPGKFTIKKIGKKSPFGRVTLGPAAWRRTKNAGEGFSRPDQQPALDRGQGRL